MLSSYQRTKKRTHTEKNYKHKHQLSADTQVTGVPLRNSKPQTASLRHKNTTALANQFYEFYDSNKDSNKLLMPKVYQLNYDQNFVSERELVDNADSCTKGIVYTSVRLQPH